MINPKTLCDGCGKKKRRRHIIIFKKEFFCSNCFYKKCKKIPTFDVSINKKMNSLEKEAEMEKIRQKKRRDNNRKLGLCTSCGRKKKAKKYLMCLKCRKKERKRFVKYIEKDREIYNQKMRNWYRKRHNVPPSRWKV